MTQAQVLKALAAINPDFLAHLAGKPAKLAKRSKADMLAAKDRSIRATFTKRGVKDVVLMDRTDATKAFNVKPYKAWLAEGRVVQKGQKSVRGLFHVSQTQPVAE